MMRAVILLVALAACSPAAPPPESAPVQSAPQAEAVAPPTLAAVEIGRAEDGTTINVRIGQTLVVRLSGNTSTGVKWQAVETPAFLTPTDAPLAPEASQEPPVIGAGGTESLAFVANAAGTGEVVIEQRSFGGAGPARGVFRVTVVAQ